MNEHEIILGLADDLEDLRRSMVAVLSAVQDHQAAMGEALLSEQLVVDLEAGVGSVGRLADYLTAAELSDPALD